MMGVDLDTFYRMTPRQFQNIVIGNLKRQEADLRERWMQTRKMMYAFLTPYNKDNLSERQMFPFAWEEADANTQAPDGSYIKQIDEGRRRWEIIDEKKRRRNLA